LRLLAQLCVTVVWVWSFELKTSKAMA
jgi:hypothetical protein